MRDETFGPMLPIMNLPHREEAVRLANDRRTGCLPTVHAGQGEGGPDREPVLAGTVMHNDPSTRTRRRRTPWGGVKATGSAAVARQARARDCASAPREPRAINFPPLVLPVQREGLRLGPASTER